MNILMIDYETLGLKGNVPLELGMVAFNRDGIVAEEKVSFDISHPQMKKLSICGDTLRWWLLQDSKRLEAMCLNGTLTLSQGMARLAMFYLEHGCSKVMSNWSMADLSWTDTYVEAGGCKVLKAWSFREEMCFGTLKSFFPNEKVDFEGVPHDALDDAKWQAYYMIEILKKMEKING